MALLFDNFWYNIFNLLWFGVIVISRLWTREQIIKEQTDYVIDWDIEKVIIIKIERLVIDCVEKNVVMLIRERE